MNTILEIIKYTLPSLIVFATVYFMMKYFFANELAVKSMEFKQKQFNQTLPLKLQAYERLALFTERISIENLRFRLSAKNMDAQSLGNAMMVAIQQEYEHNLSQQIYVSDRLWDIISLAKDNMQNLISQGMQQSQNGTAADLMVVLMQVGGGKDIQLQVRKAISKEVEIVM